MLLDKAGFEPKAAALYSNVLESPPLALRIPLAPDFADKKGDINDNPWPGTNVGHTSVRKRSGPSVVSIRLKDQEGNSRVGQPPTSSDVTENGRLGLSNL